MHPVSTTASTSPRPQGAQAQGGDEPGLSVRGIEDHRRPARGWSRLLVVALGLTGAVILFPSLVALIRQPATAPVLGALNVVCGALFILVAVCVAHNGRRMRMIGWMSLTALFTGAALFGLLTRAHIVPDLSASVWNDGGARLLYVPLVLPLVTGVWMWWSDPRRIVVVAEKIEDLAQAVHKN